MAMTNQPKMKPVECLLQPGSLVSIRNFENRLFGVVTSVNKHNFKITWQQPTPTYQVYSFSGNIFEYDFRVEKF